MSPADIIGGVMRINLVAGVAILGVVALRKLVRTRFGARLAYGLWLLPALAGAAALLPARQVVVMRSTPLGAASSAVPASPSAAAMSLDPLVLVGLWLVGVAAAALVMALLQQRFMHQARRGVVGPAVIGVIAPRILTPRDFAERYSLREQALVLAHEQAHIARQDSRLNGLCAGAQCLFWFNPLVHLAARLMRIDQELACDEAVVARFPTARRAYAEVLVKAQLAVLPLPLGCYWPPTTEHPLVERVAMLRRKDIGHPRTSTGAVVLMALCVGSGLAAWASQPADVRFLAPKPAWIAAASSPSLQSPRKVAVSPRPVKIVTRDHLTNQTSLEAAPSTITAAQDDASPTLDRAVAETDAVSSLSVQDIALPQAKLTPSDQGAPPIAQPAALQPSLAVTPALIKASQKTGLVDDPDQILCKVQAVTGSRFIRRVCTTKSEWKQQQRRLLSFERLWSLDPSGFAAAEY